MQLKLINKREEVKNIISFFLKPEHEIFWRAGQFLRYHITDPNHDDRNENRFFSIASAPFEGNIMLTTKFTEDDGSTFKKDLKTLEVGNTIQAFGPAGSFIIDDPNKQYIFIAGGIGITPFRSILLDLNHKEAPINIKLLYANRTAEPIFVKELEALKINNKDFKIHYFIGDQMINEQIIRSLISDIGHPIFYISGPQPMVEASENMLERMEIPREHIKKDYFLGYTQI